MHGDSRGDSIEDQGKNERYHVLGNYALCDFKLDSGIVTNAKVAKETVHNMNHLIKLGFGGSNL